MSDLSRDLERLAILVSKELKIRYKRSVFGYIWAVVNPLAFALVYYVAFKLIMRIEVENYAIFLLSAMFPWMWLANALRTATSTFSDNASLVKYVTLPRYILPLSVISHEAIHFLFALPVLLVFVVFGGGEFHPSWMWQILILIPLQFVLVYPFCLLFSLFNVFVADVEHLVGIALSMLFFLTPIVYPIEMVPESLKMFMNLSPVAALIEVWRSVLLHGEIVWPKVLVCLSTAMILGGIASIYYRRTSIKIAERL